MYVLKNIYLKSKSLRLAIFQISFYVWKYQFHLLKPQYTQYVSNTYQSNQNHHKKISIIKSIQ